MKYVINLDVYETASCTSSDVVLHFDKVKEVVSDSESTIYQTRMYESIAQGLAFKVYRNEELCGFIYTTIKDKVGEGVSIWGNDSIASILLLKDAFTDYPSHKIVVKPHTNEFLMYKSLLSLTSIKNYHNLKLPLVIHLKDVIAKYSSVFVRLGITNG